jgi:hypothetical protein
MNKEYKRAFSLLGMKIGIISNDKTALYDDEYFLGKGGYLHSLLSNFHRIEPIPYEKDNDKMDMIFNIFDKNSQDFSFESNGSVYKISGPIKRNEESTNDKRSSIFGNMGIFSKVAILELEKKGIFSFHSTCFIHPLTNVLYLVLGSSGAGKSTVLLKAIKENMKVFGTELVHIQIENSKVTFFKGSIWQNCRMGNLVEDFPSLLKKFNIDYKPEGNPWQKYTSINMSKWQYHENIIVNPKIIILYPRIESERSMPERIEMDTAGSAYQLFENLSDKVSPPSLVYKKYFIPSVDNKEDQIRRMNKTRKFIRCANINASWKILTGPDACLDYMI